jgi:TP53 regulating kinase-like protein
MMIPFKTGAEASLYRSDWYGREAMFKVRMPKAYRHPSLDYRLRTSRTIREAENLHEAKKAAVPTPLVYFVDMDNATLVMEYVQGPRVKEILDKLNHQDRVKLCEGIGMHIGQLHRASLIHGDLTTSNMIRLEEDKVVLIDFGLSFHSHNEEDMGVDLHLMKRVLDSTHHFHSQEAMMAILSGYEKIVGNQSSLRVLKKVREIECRGRYSGERL